MADQAYIPVEGTTIAYSNASNGSYTSIPTPNLNSVSPANPEYNRVDTWGLGSSAKSSRPGQIPEPGQLIFKCSWDPAGTVCSALRTARDAMTTYYYKITYVGDGLNNHSTEIVPGWIQKIEIAEMTEENNIEATVTVQATALPIYTAGS